MHLPLHHRLHLLRTQAHALLKQHSAEPSQPVALQPHPPARAPWPPAPAVPVSLSVAGCERDAFQPGNTPRESTPAPHFLCPSLLRTASGMLSNPAAPQGSPHLHIRLHLLHVGARGLQLHLQRLLPLLRQDKLLALCVSELIQDLGSG